MTKPRRNCYGEESIECPYCGEYNTVFKRVRDNPIYGDVEFWDCEECNHQFGGDLPYPDTVIVGASSSDPES